LIFAGSTVAVAWGPNRLDTFVHGTDNQDWHKAWGGASVATTRWADF
jgi:hypothetical protein